MLEAVLLRAWRRRGPLVQLLRPLSWLYGALAGTRRQLYRIGLRRSEQASVPVVVIGNVVAGGAGKTPVVMAIVRHLQARGIACGVISRGHGRVADHQHPTREVRPGDDASAVGDEPLLIATRTGVPVVVGARRIDAARVLVQRHPGVRIILSDDGLQHLALARDIEICVFDDRGVGNGLLLPAGPLRERWPRRVDLVLRPAGMAWPGFAIQRRLAAEAVRSDGLRVPLSQLRGTGRAPTVAITAIARPHAFFEMLRGAGLAVDLTVTRPDHDPLDRLPELAQLPAEATLVCTEKDAVKLWRHAPQAWAVPLEIEIEAAFWAAFDRQLDAKLSSRDGLQTA